MNQLVLDKRRTSGENWLGKGRRRCRIGQSSALAWPVKP
ncbi:hypothetical protein [Polaromonas sp. CG9_12]|nr:hypothetical protein [Polaromonas sp. CG9_12]